MLRRPQNLLPFDPHFRTAKIEVEDTSHALTIRNTDFESGGRGGLRFAIERGYSSRDSRRQVEPQIDAILADVFQRLLEQAQGISSTIANAVRVANSWDDSQVAAYLSQVHGQWCNQEAPACLACFAIPEAISAAICAGICFSDFNNEKNACNDEKDAWKADYDGHLITLAAYARRLRDHDWLVFSGVVSGPADWCFDFPSNTWIDDGAQAPPTATCGPPPKIVALVTLESLRVLDEVTDGTTTAYEEIVLPYLVDRAAATASARKTPIRVGGFGSGWSLGLPILELYVGGGAIYFEGTRRYELASTDAAVVPAEDAVFWRLGEDPPDVELPAPEADACAVDNADVSPACFLANFGSDNFMLDPGPVMIGGQSRPELEYRMTVRDRVYYFDALGLLRVITDPSHANSIEIEWSGSYSTNADALLNGRIQQIVDAAGNSFELRYASEPYLNLRRQEIGADGNPASDANVLSYMDWLPDPPLIRSIVGPEKTTWYGYKLLRVRRSGCKECESLPPTRGQELWVLTQVSVPNLMTYSFDYDSEPFFRCSRGLATAGSGGATAWCGGGAPDGDPVAVHGARLKTHVTPAGGSVFVEYNDNLPDPDSAFEFEAGQSQGIPIVALHAQWTSSLHPRCAFEALGSVPSECAPMGGTPERWV